MAARRGNGLRLNRREHETVVVRCPDGTEIFVTNVGYGTIKLLIGAPESVEIWKLETDPRRTNQPTPLADTQVIPASAVARELVKAVQAEADSEGGEM